MKETPEDPWRVDDAGRVPGRDLNDLEVVAGQISAKGKSERRFRQRRDGEDRDERPGAPAARQTSVLVQEPRVLDVALARRRTLAGALPAPALRRA